MWTRHKTPPTSTPAPTDKLLQAVDAVAAVLRLYGRYAFDTEEYSAEDTQAACESQAEALLIGERPAERSEGPPSGIVRDWRGVRAFFADRRKQEAEFVQTSLGNLRQAVQTFAQCLSGAMAGDRRSDSEVARHVGALSAALSSNDTESIRKEAGAVVETVRAAMTHRRAREEKQLKLLAERLRYLGAALTEARAAAATDAMTQLSNRAALDAHLARVADLGLLFAEPPCLLMVDLDRFKEVNDKFGHPAGDEVLKEVAKQLTRSFLRKQDFVARYGGEEFAVVLVDTDLEGAKMLVSRVCNAVRDSSIVYQDAEIGVTLSVGIAQLTLGEAPEAWLARADRALYMAKEAGRDRIVAAAA